MPPLRAFLLLLGIVAGALAPALHGALAIVPDRGTLPSGVDYAVLKPAAWDQRRLLLWAPAQRAADQPAEAALDVAHPLVRALLAEGWCLATAAYRRPGVVLKDSMDDLEALRKNVAAAHGQPDRVYLLGESLGAGIAVRMVENFGDDYAGALAVGGAFDLNEPAPTIGVSFSPHRPLLLLPNRSESHAPDGYVKASGGAPVRPVLWRIDRDGRSNTNTAEKLAALAALVRWVEDGAVPPPDFDATIPPPPQSSVVEFTPDGAVATGQVRAVDPLRGDITIDFQPADLARLGIERGTYFAVDFGGGPDARTLRVLYGQIFRTAKRHDWMALPEAEGWMLLSAYRGNAAAISGLKPGDKIALRRLRR